ncbi:MAG: GNAT family N-acetyltransferase, partial [Methylobacteriaceae bacterium]|nr:GNAT family N-acetyltransferase [Methylobacteriaceae bacterium]
MAEITMSIRRARTEDAAALSAVSDAAWREAYQGILPALWLERMIGRRGPRWWLSTVSRGRPLVVLDVGERVAGYVSYGRCRDRALPA